MNNLPWLLLLLPLLAAALDWLCFRKNPGAATAVSLISVLLTLGLTLAIYAGLCTGTPDAYVWMSDGLLNLHLGLTLDTLAVRMMLVVTGIGSLIHIFSIGYMKGDPSNLSRYFAGLSIFMFSMTMIVLADNLAMTFIGWEMVGFSSYLLIGHWFHKASAADAAKKAFITNRVGDFGFLIGILLTEHIRHTLVVAYGCTRVELKHLLAERRVAHKVRTDIPRNHIRIDGLHITFARLVIDGVVGERILRERSTEASHDTGELLLIEL